MDTSQNLWHHVIGPLDAKNASGSRCERNSMTIEMIQCDQCKKQKPKRGELAIMMNREGDETEQIHLTFYLKSKLAKLPTAQTKDFCSFDCLEKWISEFKNGKT